MPREYWRASELLALGWTPRDFVAFFSERPCIRLDGEPAYSVARVDKALAKSALLRAQIVAHVEPAPGVWLHTLAAVASANGISEHAAKKRLGEPATYRRRKMARGYWGAYTVAQIEWAGLRLPARVKGPAI